jgi:NDP-sugar pyrophosphorylase family protein
VPYGVIECEGHAVQSIKEKPVFNFFVNAGIYLLEPSAIRLLSENKDRLDMTDLIELLIQKGRPVVSFPILERWIDIGRLEDYEQAVQKAKTLTKPRGTESYELEK